MNAELAPPPGSVLEVQADPVPGQVVVGIDPGKRGAIAYLPARAGRPPHLEPMPLLRSHKGRDEYDLVAIAGLLGSLLEPVVTTTGPRGARGARFRSVEYHRTLAFVELGNPLPRSMGGGSANYHRGYSRGILEGILVALGIPYALVPPRAWQRAMLAGTSGADTKQRAVIAASRLFPTVSLLPTPRCRKPSDGMADALLLAEYGRRTLAASPGEGIT